VNAELRFLAAASAIAMAQVAAHAQDRAAYPAKPVRVIVPAQPGSPPDASMRLLGAELTNSLRQPVLVENRPGAVGTIGLGAVAKAPADGYTLGVFSFGSMLGPTLVASMPLDIERELTAVALFARDFNILIVPAGSPTKSIPELIAAARARPGALKFASGGNGTPARLVGEQFKREAGIDIAHIPYKSPVAGATAVLTGEIDMMFGATVAVGPYVKSGKVRALATLAPRRLSAYPDVPTVAELGYPNLAFSGWFGVIAPAATPRDVIARLHREISRIAALPETRQRFEAIGMEPADAGPEAMATLWRADLAKWNKVARDAGIQAD
jgi:tripartite-type tricarboxylate transporter receptor subunit TctC